MHSAYVNSLLVALCAAACTSSPTETDGEIGATDATSASTDPASGGDDTDEPNPADPTGAPDADGTLGEGLPCEIQDLVAANCVGCHGATPVGNQATMLTRDDFLAAALSDPSRPRGEVALDRMGSATAPMPPAPTAPVPRPEVDIFAAWVADGMPAGDCTPDDAEPDPFDVDPICTSDVWWTRGDDEDPRMHPGMACIECHTREDEGPRFAIAGTIFPTGHEPDDCFGSPAVTVEVTDADGRTVTLERSNNAGNFFLEDRDAPSGFAPPYTVKLLRDGTERKMLMPAPSGDCNGCHSQNGTDDAPGRVLAP